MTPLRRPKPAFLEGPNAFSLRVAEANLLTTREVHEMELLDTWPAVQEMLEQISPFRRKSAAYCPTCLERRGVGRVGWELTFADACADCGRWLVDTCHACGQRLSWNRSSLTFCGCGSSLLDQTAPSAPAALVDLSRALEASLADGSKVRGDDISALSIRQLSDLVRLLGSYAVYGDQERPQKRAFSTSLATSWPVSTVAAEVLAGWPSAFDRFLVQIAARSTSPDSSGSLQRVFGGFYRALYTGLKDPAFSFLRERFEAYAIEQWTGALALRNRRLDPDLLPQSGWVPAAYAQARLGVSATRLSSLVTAGQVRAVERTSTSGRRFVVLRREDVEASASAVKSEVTLADAAEHLGLKRSRLAALLRHICPEARQAVPGSSPWAIPRSWIDAWSARLALLPVVARSSTREDLGRVLRFGAWPVRRLAHLINAVASGELQPAGRVVGVVGLAAMAFDANELVSWVQRKQKPSPVVTVPQAAAKLGVKQEVAYHLIRHGLLESTIRRHASRKAAWVSETQLQRFSQTYVWCRDLASMLAMSPRATAALLSKEGIQPVSGPLIDKCRQLLYRRHDVSLSRQFLNRTIGEDREGEAN